uniref:WAP domain-containing protein n=1 Tax=Cyprinodon variegatus TaxID=28743 RepID=A0A3Q2D0K0_CYPVA
HVHWLGKLSCTLQDPCPLVFQTLLPARPCQNDGHCPGQEKCCSFAGGSACAPPIITNPACPNTDGKIGPCVELCSSDFDCPAGEICCSNGCGRMCISTEKPGSCSPPWMFSWCYNSCLRDSDCSENQKCCPTFWGLFCQEPYNPAI